MLGRELNLPVDIVYPIMQNKGYADDSKEDYVGNLEGAMKSAHEIARKVLGVSQERMKRDYDLRANKKCFDSGDIVFILDTAQIKGKCKKLAPPWKGPGIIISKLSSYLYRVKVRNTIMIANHDRLALCKTRQLPPWLAKYKDNFQALIKSVPNSTGYQSTPYCLCRRPYTGEFMIQCDDCDEWYHGFCVNVSSDDALRVGKYACPLCKEKRK